MTIEYSNRTKFKILPYKKMLRIALEETLKFENASTDVSVCVSFVNNDEIRELNRTYRDKDSSTDVLSFPMIDYESGKVFADMKDELIDYIDPSSNKVMLGDIVVSLETIEVQAKDFKVSFEDELMLMVIHSMLHLMGYDHMVKSEEKVMFRKQEAILERAKIKYEKYKSI